MAHVDLADVLPPCGDPGPATTNEASISGCIGAYLCAPPIVLRSRTTGRLSASPAV
jgi:hypothetical protein